METEPATEKASSRSIIKRWVFWPAAVVVIVFSAFALIAPRAAEAMFAAVQASIIHWFSWYYVLLAAFFVAFSLFVGFSRFGDIRLGRDDDKPEFSLGGLVRPAVRRGHGDRPGLLRGE